MHDHPSSDKTKKKLLGEHRLALLTGETLLPEHETFLLGPLPGLRVAPRTVVARNATVGIAPDLHRSRAHDPGWIRVRKDRWCRDSVAAITAFPYRNAQHLHCLSLSEPFLARLSTLPHSSRERKV